MSKLFKCLLTISALLNLPIVGCDEIVNAANAPVIINQSFSDYQKERKGGALQLFFPCGRIPSNPNDPRGKQQNHPESYTIDHDKSCNPHTTGSLFNEKTWEGIPDNFIDVIHVEIPGCLMFYGPKQVPGRQEKDAFLLQKISEKCEIGGKLFVDLRYSRFQPKHSNIQFPTNQIATTMRQYLKGDSNSFFSCAYDHDIEQYATYINTILDEGNLTILDILKSQPSSEYSDLLKRVKEKEQTLSSKELLKLRAPYIIFFNQEIRKNIFREYDALLRLYGFERTKPIIELRGRIFNKAPLPEGCEKMGSIVIYKGMCFLDAVANYRKVREIKKA